MPEDNGPTMAARSGSQAGRNYSRNNRAAAAPQEVTGDLKELGSKVFKLGTRDQADAYLSALEAIAGYLEREVSREMRRLVWFDEVKTFTEPALPTGAVSEARLAKYKRQYDDYCKDKKKYDEQKAQTFVIMLGQCTEAMKAAVMNDSRFDQLERNEDVVGLKNLLREMAYGTGGILYEYMALALVLRRLTAHNQGQTESVANYYHRFKSISQVVEEQWGMFFPTLKGGNTDASKKTARDQLMAMIFLAGADKKRFEKLIDNLNNEFLAGKNNYPVSLETTLTLLSNYQQHEPRVRFSTLVDDNPPTGTETSFQQMGRGGGQLSRVRCYHCQEYGHVLRNCPRLRQSHGQVGHQESVREESAADDHGQEVIDRRPGVAFYG